ncbi:hypothetical protein [Coleofasciculus sp. FACHB-129]|uniref:hypothetical protein n=1 Tax=Cyanophyceae TaxID=3028117 RepID=UPI001683643D|nr:hypothetical protein [Coleofasciculus sp. FACHB-129]MBD1893157.1 hypothetical protein [Coleofasciculus sp. FACHB-129]
MKLGNTEFGIGFVKLLDKERGLFFGVIAHLKKPTIQKKPDILIVSRELGLIIIEVKSCGINDIEAIEANRCQMN